MLSIEVEVVNQSNRTIYELTNALHYLNLLFNGKRL